MWFKRLLSYVTLLAVILLVGAWFFTFRPTFLGGRAVYITVTGRSMEPTLQSGDLVILHERYTYRIGDIVAYPIPAGEAGAGSRVIHRIVGGSGAEGYVTKGDNRTAEDRWRPTDADVLGSMWLRAPGVGRFLPRLRAPLVIASLAAVVAVWFVLDLGKKPKPHSE